VEKTTQKRAIGEKGFYARKLLKRSKIWLNEDAELNQKEWNAGIKTKELAISGLVRGAKIQANPNCFKIVRKRAVCTGMGTEFRSAFQDRRGWQMAA
jgi:hypothetical protein